MRLVTDIKKLKNKVEPSNLTENQWDALEDTLLERLDDIGGIGLSANQIGINARGCVIQIGTNNHIFLQNPRIVERSKEQVTYREGCLSIPKTLKKPVITVRHERIVVEADNFEGQLVFEPSIRDKWDIGAKYFWADEGLLESVAVQHEIDHLDGITIKDRVYKETATKLHKYGRNDKVMILDPDTGDSKFIKFKHAEPLIEMGWQLQ